jgi:hypothetical protein
MDEETKKLLEKNLAVSQESLKILKKMHRGAMISRFLKVLYWLMILGIIIGGYIYLQPFIHQLQDIYQGLPDLPNLSLPR